MPVKKQIYGEPTVFPEFRIQYVSLSTPDTGHKFSTDKYGFRALISKENKKSLKPVMKILCEMAKVDSIDELEKHPFGNKKGELHDGDSPKNIEKEGHKGHIFLNLYSKDPIQTFILGDDGEPEVCDPSEIYAGCYCVAAITPALYDEGEATVYPNSVMKVRDGKPFTSGGGTDTKSLLASWAGAPEKKKAKVADDEDEAPKAKKKKASVLEDDDEETSDSDDDDEEAPKKTGKRGRPAGSKNKPSKPSILDDDDDDEEAQPKKKKKAAVIEEDDDEPADEEVEDEDEEEERPKKKKAKTINDLFDD